MATQTPEAWHIDRQTLTELQGCIPQFHKVLAWLSRPPSSEERTEAFARLFPVVSRLEALVAAIVKEKVPEAGAYLDAIQRAVETVQVRLAAGELTSEAAQRILEELEQRQERMMARALALALAEEKAGHPPGKEGSAKEPHREQRGSGASTIVAPPS